LSLSKMDLAFLDEYATTQASPSRSAVIREAIDALRLSDLGNAYRDAWGRVEAEWRSRGVGSD
jgi:Arc/MetJ-type ribon-helix-helix transcriptional regulator